MQIEAQPVDYAPLNSAVAELPEMELNPPYGLAIPPPLRLVNNNELTSIRGWTAGQPGSLCGTA